MERDEIHERIAAIRVQFEEMRAELDNLIAQLGDDDRGSGRPKFTIITGGLGAFALPIVAPGRQSRRRVGLGIAASVVGAMGAVLLVPAHTTPGGPGDAISYLSIPASPPASAIGRTAVGTHTPGAPVASATQEPNIPGAPSEAAPVRTPAAPGVAPRSPSPSRSPTPTGTPSATSTATPSTSASPTPSAAPCLVTIGVGGIVKICLL